MRGQAGALRATGPPVVDGAASPVLAANPRLSGRNVIACRIGHPLVRHPNLTTGAVAHWPLNAPPPESPPYHDLRAVLDRIGAKDLKVHLSGGSLTSILNSLYKPDALTILPFPVVYRLNRQSVLAAPSLLVGDPDRHLCALISKAAPSFPARTQLLIVWRRICRPSTT